MGTVRISYGCSYNSQGIINRPIHGALICPQSLGCPSHHARFKKMCNCVKVVMFHAMIFVMGGTNKAHYMYAKFLGDKYKLICKLFWVNMPNMA